MTKNKKYYNFFFPQILTKNLKWAHSKVLYHLPGVLGLTENP